MNNYPHLLEKIKKLQRKHKTLIIGIDGVGGGGKTTLANYLAGHLTSTTIVQMDGFYSPTLGMPDIDRVLMQVLAPLVEDRISTYQIYNWIKDSLEETREIKPGGTVILEGIFSLHSNFVNLYDFRIWINCDPELGFKRGAERDKLRDGVDNTDKWVNIWMPKEKEYHQSQNPQQHADYIVNVD